MKQLLTKSRRQVAFVLVILLALSSLAGCSSKKENSSDASNGPLTKTSFLLNTVVTITLYDSTDESILDETLDLCKKYENIFSRTSSTSELYKLNEGLLEKDKDGYIVSDELYNLIKTGVKYGDLSKGKFDIAIEPVSSLWDFTAEDPVVPKASDIKKNLPLVNYKDIVVSKKNRISFKKEGMGIDLGAIAKGYIADQLKAFLLKNNVKSAMINLGGNVLCVGKKVDGSAFNIGIQKPFADRNETIAIMQLEDVSVVSSGIYERYFTVNGKSYHHILNPATGYSYDNNLVGLTIVSKTSVDGDGLSTSCFALGLKDGMALIDSLDDTYAVFITKDNKVHYSSNFKKHIKITEVSN
ncbi:hypothetical similar to thiamin biosynthesis lipoprotein ApbE [Lachnospiraceae bacterium KM106-2]|nr:hypothetical similar to thiamin biosynthesis lipoprotein ApbE [Lachnospiraceae bacterium KM106-2]